MRILLTTAACLSLPGCVRDDEPPDALVLATTTSVRDSGLLDLLLPAFRQQSGIEVNVLAVGSGQALELGRRGDADVLITHAPEAEARFVADGYGVRRHVLMKSAFLIVGPKSDAAGLREAGSAAEAFQRIAEFRVPFVSRGDESGTHLRERKLWTAAGVQPQDDWYFEAGTGMAEALRIASEKQACTLSDRGTWLAQQRRLDLAVLYEGDPLLENIYAVIAVNPERHPHVRSADVRVFVEFLLHPSTRRRVATFGTAAFGEPLFQPAGAD